jgi:uncharacterized protein
MDDDAAAMPQIPGIRVVRSKIHGYGLIATCDFAVGEIVFHVEGIMYTEDELGDDTYALWIDDGIYMDMVDQTRWTNHSCEPNGEIEADVGPDGQAWARLVCIRPISAGEEITYDYGFALEHAEPCFCGAPTCRRLIVDPRELPPRPAEAGEGA